MQHRDRDWSCSQSQDLTSNRVCILFLKRNHDVADQSKYRTCSVDQSKCRIVFCILIGQAPRGADRDRV